jgi:uncharacterized C2H2 Zn-finger protein
MPYVEYDEVQAVCSDCGRIFPTDEALAAHRTEAHSGLEPPGGASKPKQIECSVCQKRFRSTAALTDHNRKAHTS